MPIFAERLRHQSSEVSLAEQLEVMKLLQPADEVARAAMLRCLGLQTDVAMAVAPPELEPGGGLADEKPTLDAPRFAKLPDFTPTPAPPPPAELPSGVRLLEPEREDPVTVELLVGRPLPGPVTVLPRDRPRHLAPPPAIPLLAPHWFPAIARALLATLEPSSEIDVAYLEKRLITGRPLERLPWRRRLSFRRGVHVLLDHSESMQPFWRDGDELVTRLRRLLGKPAVRPRRFRLHRWGIPGRRWIWLGPDPVEFQAGAPVLIVSDFGLHLGEGVEPEIWQKVLQPAHDLSCPLLALVPAPESAWHPWLQQIIPRVYEWDRSTSPRVTQRGASRSTT